MITTQDVRTKLDKLTALGTPDAIAWELEAQGITGRPRRPDECAIARYLGNRGDWDWLVLWREPFVLVARDGTTVVDDDGGDDEIVPHTDVIAEFTRRFDDGAYPALITNDR